MVCLLPFFDLFFNVVAYYFLTLLDILKIKNRFLISCESIGGHNIVPPVAGLAIVDGYIPERSLNQFNPDTFVDWGMWMREVGEKTLRSIA